MCNSNIIKTLNDKCSAKKKHCVWAALIQSLNKIEEKIDCLQKPEDDQWTILYLCPTISQNSLTVDEISTEEIKKIILDNKSLPEIFSIIMHRLFISDVTAFTRPRLHKLRDVLKYTKPKPVTGNIQDYSSINKICTILAGQHNTIFLTIFQKIFITIEQEINTSPNQTRALLYKPTTNNNKTNVTESAMSEIETIFLGNHKISDVLDEFSQRLFLSKKTPAGIQQLYSIKDILEGSHAKDRFNELKGTKFLRNNNLRELFLHRTKNCKWSKCIDYLNTLEDKINRANYYETRVKYLWDKLFNKSPLFKDATSGFKKISVLSQNQKKPEIKHTFFCIASEIESMIHNINSLFDILLHIFNYLFLPKPVEEEALDFENLKEKLDSQKTTLLKSLKQSTEFKYIRDFCNTSKHQQVHYHYFQENINFHPPYKPSSLTFNKFRSHPAKTDCEIIDDKNKVVNEILKLLNGLNIIL
ncbi:MAG: hypothetical protein AB1454_14095 [Candidatus Auribacterota bacterium]